MINQIELFLSQYNNHFGRQITVGPDFSEALNLADDEAKMLGHSSIGTEHEFLGIIAEDSNPTLKALGFKLLQVRTEVARITGRGRKHYAIRDISPNGRRAIEISINEANKLGESILDSGHLLLGVMNVDNGIAHGLVEFMGSSPDLIIKTELHRRRQLIHP